MLISLISSIVGTLIGTLITAYQQWKEKAEAEADAWNSRSYHEQLQSAVKANTVQKAIAEAATKPPLALTPTQWNAGVRVLIIMLVLFTSGGCVKRTVYVNSKCPVIEAPARPTLEDTSTPFTPRETIFMQYARQLEQAINAYNTYAKEENTRNGYPTD